MPQPTGLLAPNTPQGAQPNNAADMRQLYGLLAQYADDPTAVGLSYARSMQDAARMQQATKTSAPANVREWEYYNSLSPEDQKRYLEMKRGIDFQNIGGNVVRTFGGADEGPYSGVGEVVSTLAQEGGAKSYLNAAGKMGTDLGARYTSLKSSQRERVENYSEAKRLRGLVSSNDLPTGKYTGLVYKVLPTADQEALDALAEQVARAKLKANGESRPTNEDVDGMKASIFGSAKTEEFTVDSLERLMREIESQQQDFNRISEYLNPMITPGSAPQDFANGQFEMPKVNQVGVPADQRQQKPRSDLDNLSVDQLLELQRRRKNSGR